MTDAVDLRFILFAWIERDLSPKWYLRSWPDGARYWALGRLRVKWGWWGEQIGGRRLFLSLRDCPGGRV